MDSNIYGEYTALLEKKLSPYRLHHSLEVAKSAQYLAKKYGGVIVALTLDEAGIPDSAEKRLEIAKRILAEANKYGIKPVIGCEVYVANRSRFSKEHMMDWSYHLVLLCENNTGYKNLIKLVSAGFTEGFYKKPRVDKELLKKQKEKQNH